MLEILWCGHSDERSLVVLSDGDVFSMVYQVKFVYFFFLKLNYDFFVYLGSLGSERFHGEVNLYIWRYG